jgi:hypothetical protein
MSLPTWPPRDWRALLALIASVAGAATLTGFAAWLVTILRQWHGFDELRIRIFGNALYGLLFIVGIVLVSLGLAINKRSVKGSILGASFSAEGGDDAPAAAQTVATAAQDSADKISEGSANAS